MKMIILLLINGLLMPVGWTTEWRPTSAEDLNQKWFIGEKDQVLKYAEARLKGNPADLIGLLVEWNYAISFMDVERIREVGPKLKRAVSEHDSPEFSKRKSWLISDVDVITKLLNDLSPELIESEGRKGLISGKPMDILRHISDLEKDGYFQTKYFSPEGHVGQTRAVMERETPAKPNAIWWILGGMITIVVTIYLAWRRKK